MFRELNKKDLQHAVTTNSKKLTGLFGFLSDPITLEIMSILAIEPLTYKALKVDFSDLDKNAVASYLVHLSEFGYIGVNKKEEYYLTDEGEDLLVSSLKTIFYDLLDEENNENLKPIFARIFGGRDIREIKRKHTMLTANVRLGIGARLRTSKRDAMK